MRAMPKLLIPMQAVYACSERPLRVAVPTNYVGGLDSLAEL